MIKNIIFDFGDIFINLDKEATYREMAKLGVTDISSDMIATYYKYEMGLLTTNEFISFYKNKKGEYNIRFFNYNLKTEKYYVNFYRIDNLKIREKLFY
ncbi:hypothetical protein V2762_01610 [Tenacibaculum maritimum]|uniref:hypothetical protein n=1 Tax=Tenacibaculum maritimum TaxID=107401 RepID=UPI003875DF12